MTGAMKGFFRTSVWGSLLVLQGIVSPAVADGASVLDRVLSTLDTGALPKKPSKERRTVLLNMAANRAAPVDGGGKGIEGSVSVRFDRTNETLLSETVSGLTTSSSHQRMEGRVGDVATIVLGASLDQSASINQVEQTLHSEDASALPDASSLPHQPLHILAGNVAMNEANLDGSVSIEANGYGMDVGTLSTSVIGAFGGGSIKIGPSLSTQDNSGS